MYLYIKGRKAMSIKSFYKGYILAFILVMILCLMKLSFIEVMATLGISLVGTVIIFSVGWVLYRTYLYIYNIGDHSGGS